MTDAHWRRWRERRPPAELLHLDTAAVVPCEWGPNLHGIVTTAGAVSRAPREMTAPLLRISPHVDCTPEDLARLRQALLTLGSS